MARHTAKPHKIRKVGILVIQILSFLLILVIVITIAAPSKVYAEENEVTTLTVSGNMSESVMEEYIQAFETKYPDIQVQYIYAIDYEEQIKNDIENDNLSDVIFVPGYFGTSDMKNYLQPLGNYSGLSEQYNYLQGAKMIGEVIYGLPSNAYVSGFLYNKEVFEKAGISMLPASSDEFIADLKMIDSRTDAIPFFTNYDEGWALDIWETFTYIEMSGSSSYRYGNFLSEVNPYSAEGYHGKVYSLLYEIVAEGLCETDEDDISWEQSKAMLNNGEIGCIAIGSWALKQIKDAGDNVAFMPYPNEINGTSYVTIDTDYCYAIARDSDNKAAARKYIDFMLDESGYSVNRENLSIAKTDPYPDSYQNIENAVLLMSEIASSESYEYYDTLSADLRLPDEIETRRIIDAAKSGSDINEIFDDWNERWESNRPEMTPTTDMVTTIENVIQGLEVDNYQVNLSEEESSYIENIGLLNVGYMTDLAPFSYERDGEFGGLSRQILDVVEEESGLSFEYKPYKNYSELKQALQNGEIDIITVANKGINEENLRTSKSILDYMMVVAKNDKSSIESTESGGSNKIAFVEGQDPTIEVLDYATERIKTYESFPDALEAVEKGEVDYMLANYYSASYYVSALELSNVKVISVSNDASYAFAFSSEVNTALVSIINKCLYSLDENNVQIMMLSEMEPPAKEVTIKSLFEEYTLECMLALIALIYYQSRKRIWESEKKFATRDQLVNVYNRVGFREQVEIVNKKARETCLIMLDLDYFKSVNDNLGHAGGDVALVQLGDSLNEVFSENAIVARFGGDEFSVYVYDKSKEAIEQLLKNIVDKMDTTIEYDKKVQKLSISLGAAYTQGVMDLEEIMKRADEQLYEVKESGKNNYKIVEI